VGEAAPDRGPLLLWVRAREAIALIGLPRRPRPALRLLQLRPATRRAFQSRSVSRLLRSRRAGAADFSRPFSANGPGSPGLFGPPGESRFTILSHAAGRRALSWLFASGVESQLGKQVVYRVRVCSCSARSPLSSVYPWLVKHAHCVSPAPSLATVFSCFAKVVRLDRLGRAPAALFQGDERFFVLEATGAERETPGRWTVRI